MIGASDWRILRRHLLPHLVPTLLVWGAIAVATNILLEVGLSFIGVGVQPSTPTWGSLLATAWGTVYNADRLRPRPDAVADDHPDGRDPDHGALAESGLRGHPACDRTVGTAMRRILAFAARRLAAAIFTLLTLIAIAFVVYWALPSTPASFVYPDGAASDRRTRSRTRTTCSASTGRRSCSTATTSRTSHAATSATSGPARSSHGQQARPDPGRRARSTPPPARRCRSSSAERCSSCCSPSRSGRSRGAASARSSDRTISIVALIGGLHAPDGARRRDPEGLRRPAPRLAAARRVLPALLARRRAAAARPTGRGISRCRGSPSRCSSSRSTRA